MKIFTGFSSRLLYVISYMDQALQALMGWGEVELLILFRKFDYLNILWGFKDFNFLFNCQCFFGWKIHRLKIGKWRKESVKSENTNIFSLYLQYIVLLSLLVSFIPLEQLLLLISEIISHLRSFVPPSIRNFHLFAQIGQFFTSASLTFNMSNSPNLLFLFCFPKYFSYLFLIFGKFLCSP